jgi:hypothetical protein
MDMNKLWKTAKSLDESSGWADSDFAFDAR